MCFCICLSTSCAAIGNEWERAGLLQLEHWIRIRTNNVIERLNREIHRSSGGDVPWWDLCSYAGLYVATLRGNPSLTIRVYKHEKALWDGFEGHLYCRLTSFIWSLQTFLRIILDSTKMRIYQWFPDSQQEVSILNKGSHGLIFLGRGALSRYNNACR